MNRFLRKTAPRNLGIDGEHSRSLSTLISYPIKPTMAAAVYIEATKTTVIFMVLVRVETERSPANNKQNIS